MISRSAHWQFGYVIPKGTLADLRARGIDAFRASVAELARFTADRVQEIASWDDVKLLTVAVERLHRWHRPGLLCIGDAAHVMSPIGGVGINLAIQDAVACANRIVGPLREGALDGCRSGGSAKAATLPDLDHATHTGRRSEPRDGTLARARGIDTPGAAVAAARYLSPASVAADCRADRRCRRAAQSTLRGRSLAHRGVDATRRRERAPLSGRTLPSHRETRSKPWQPEMRFRRCEDEPRSPHRKFASSGGRR